MRELTSRRYARALYWTAPSLLCLALYWYGLNTWFENDDFVWLGLRAGIRDWHDLLAAIFSPSRHGTFRPLSERAFFLLFHELFGIDALPYHIWIFLTFFADLILISSITARLTGSRVAGFCAPILWFVNGIMFMALGWTSAYMQILCGFFLLLAFHLLLRFAETGREKYYWWQWLVFLIGFGAMETNVVYPALAASYAILCAPRLLRRIWPLFIPSLLFVAAHMMLAPKQAAGAYAMHFDGAIFRTLWNYWRAALRPRQGWVMLAIWTAGLLGFVGFQTCRRRYLPLMFLCWFLILIAPVLPLRDHFTEYYLTLPLAGLAMLAAAAIARAWNASCIWKATAAVLSVTYFLSAVPSARGASKWFYGRGREVRTLVLGVRRAHELHRGKLILLSGVNGVLFWAALADRPFLALNIPGVYLTPDSDLSSTRELPDLSTFVLSPALIRRALDRDELEVYEVGGPHLKNITQEYEERASTLDRAEPRQVNVTSQVEEYLMGEGWYPPEGTHRWMGRRATLRIGGPDSNAQKLNVRGFCSQVELEQGPLKMTLSVDGTRLPAVSIHDCGQPFEFTFDLPAAAIGRSAIEIAVEVNRTTRLPGNPRDYGLAFGVFSII